MKTYTVRFKFRGTTHIISPLTAQDALSITQRPDILLLDISQSMLSRPVTFDQERVAIHPTAIEAHIQRPWLLRAILGGLQAVSVSPEAFDRLIQRITDRDEPEYDPERTAAGVMVVALLSLLALVGVIAWRLL